MRRHCHCGAIEVPARDSSLQSPTEMIYNRIFNNSLDRSHCASWLCNKHRILRRNPCLLLIMLWFWWFTAPLLLGAVSFQSGSAYFEHCEYIIIFNRAGAVFAAYIAAICRIHTWRYTTILTEWSGNARSPVLTFKLTYTGAHIIACKLLWLFSHPAGPERVDIPLASIPRVFDGIFSNVNTRVFSWNKYDLKEFQVNQLRLNDEIHAMFYGMPSTIAQKSMPWCNYSTKR